MADSKGRSLEERIQELQDVREIGEVWFKWHYDCTGGFNGKAAGRMEAMECLSEDATIEIHGMHEEGKGPRGPEQCTAFWAYFYGDNGPLPYVFQSSVTERVTITGDTAVQDSVQFAIFQPRGGATRSGLTQRTNHLKRTPAGWRITKVSHAGGLYFNPGELQGNLNALPEQEKRTMWSYKG
jgi:hypothetical protein